MMMWARGITVTVRCTSAATVHDLPDPVCSRMAK